MSWLRPPPDPSFGAATVYARGDALLVCAGDRTDWRTAGFIVASEHAARLPADAGDAALGQAVLDALAASRDGVPVPDRDELARRTAPLLRAAGVRSWSALARGARVCEVERDGAAIVLVPTVNGGHAGASRGFHHRPELALRLAHGGAADALGAAVREALGRAAAEVASLP